MRILVCHNQYLIHGGEEQVVKSEVSLLRDHGNEVFLHIEDNSRIERLGKVRTALRTLWSIESYRKTLSLIQQHKPDVIHVHNFFPLLSPSIYYAASKYNIPVIQTLHNFRFTCLNGLLLRDGQICEKCLEKKFAFNGVLSKCYRNSFLGSFTVAAMFAFHRFIGTWRKKVSAYIVLSEFNFQKMLKIGLPEEKLFIKSNFVLTVAGEKTKKETLAVYLGRLSSEKGIAQLLSVWEGINYPLIIIGDGPMKAIVQDVSNGNKWISYIGRLPNEEAMEYIQKALFLCVPSLYFEQPNVVLEAFSRKTAVLSSNLGSLKGMVDEARTGLKYCPRNDEEFRETILWAISHEGEIIKMGRNAYQEYREKYSPEVNYPQLLEIYQGAIDHAGSE